MKVDRQNLFNIIEKAKGKFVEQPSRMYWKDNNEITFEEKRIIAILESASMELEIDLEIDYVRRV